LAPPVLDEELRRATFNTRDATLDATLGRGENEVLSPDQRPAERRSEKLWDAGTLEDH